MAFTHGKNATITVDATALTTFIDSVGFNSNVSLADVSALSNDDEAFVAGLRNHGLALAGHFEATADAALWAMFDGAVVAWSFVVGAITYSGNAFLERYSIANPVGDKTSFSGTLKVSGPVGRA